MTYHLYKSINFVKCQVICIDFCKFWFTNWFSFTLLSLLLMGSHLDKVTDSLERWSMKNVSLARRVLFFVRIVRRPLNHRFLVAFGCYLTFAMQKKFMWCVVLPITLLHFVSLSFYCSFDRCDWRLIYSVVLLILVLLIFFSTVQFSRLALFHIFCKLTSLVQSITLFLFTIN